MTDSKHTPGPWAISGTPGRGGDIIIVNKGRDLARDGYLAKTRNEADAALIAAAPELLRLVRLLANLVEDWDASMEGDGQPLVDKARALIGEKKIPDGTPGPALLAERFRK